MRRSGTGIRTAVDQTIDLFARSRLQRLTEPVDLPGSWFHQSHHQLQRDRLATAALADDDMGRTTPDSERHILQHRLRTESCA